VENLKAKLIELEEHLFKAETRASYGELDELIADEFTEIGGSGVRFGKKKLWSVCHQNCHLRSVHLNMN
tara:strand:+ start:561 stop:767 length:207 start_codon:yes stop_codon:yes gene_type:complete